MMQNIIHNLPDWLVTSHGNGLAYELANKPAGKAVFFQGDDADTFRDAFELLTEGTPALDFCDALASIWFEYYECAEPWASPIGSTLVVQQFLRD